MCGRLNMALYGTRDAGQNFEFKTTDVLEDGGCEQGQFSPCVWFHPLKRLGIYIHGDDYVIAGGRDQSACSEAMSSRRSSSRTEESWVRDPT